MCCEPGRTVQHGVMLNRRYQHPRPPRGGLPRPVEALDGQVVGLCAAAGEDDLARPCAEGLGNQLARLLDDPAGAAAGVVQRRGVPRAGQLFCHRGHCLGQHRRRGRVIEVYRADVRVHHDDSSLTGTHLAQATRVAGPDQAVRFSISSTSCGTTLNRSPTTPKSASSKMGASGSLFTTMIVFDVCMPARCWMAPEMPTATYSCGETVLPVWPTWNWCGYQPASVTAREAPTAAPSASASSSMILKPSAEPVPRPPETTIEASASSGRALLAAVTRSVTRAALAAAETANSTGTIS